MAIVLSAGSAAGALAEEPKLRGEPSLEFLSNADNPYVKSARRRHTLGHFAISGDWRAATSSV